MTHRKQPDYAKELSTSTPRHSLNLLDQIMNDIKAGEDHSSLHLPIIKICDTRDVTLKSRINEYLLWYNDPKYLVLVTNTLLKDLNDIEPRLVLLALDFITQTNYVDEYFVKEVVRLCWSNHQNTRKMSLQALERFFCKPEWIKKYDLKKIILKLINDYGVDALIIVYDVYEVYDILGNDLWIILSNKNSDEINLMLLLIIYKKIKYENIASPESEHKETVFKNSSWSINDDNEDKFKVIMDSLYKSNSIKTIENFTENMDVKEQAGDKNTLKLKPEVIQKIKNACSIEITNDMLERVYLACKILVLIDKSTVQQVFTVLLRFAKYPTKKSYHILEYIRKLLLEHEKINYENTEFCIFESDPMYIKRIKMNILSIRFDKVAEREIVFCSKFNNLWFDCLYVCLKNDTMIPFLLAKCLEKNKIVTINILYENMPYSKNLGPHISSNLINLDLESRYEERLCHLICDSADNDEVIDKFIDNASLRTRTKTICTLLYLKKISLEKFKKLNLMKNNTEDLLRSIKRLSFITQNVLPFRPHDEMFTGYKFKTDPEEIQKTIIQTNDEPKEEIIVLYNIDRDDATLQFIGIGNIIYIRAIRVECRVELRIGCRVFVFTKNERFFLKEINVNFIYDVFETTFTGYTSFIPITLINFAMPFKCCLKEFNSKFTSIKHYEMVAYKFLKPNINELDPCAFVFKIFEEKLYAMYISGQVLLKCNNYELLKRVCVTIRKGYYK